MNMWKWNQFGEIQNISELEEYLYGREYGHGHYFHYTNLGSIEKILEGKSFRISNVQVFNDQKERKVFGSEEHLYFSLCFSTGINENLPLWYLYSGLKGDGGRVGFTKSSIRKLIENSEYELIQLDEDRKKQVGDAICSLKENDTMRSIFKDVIYFGKDEHDKMYLKYNTMTNHKISNNEIEKLKTNMKGFCKSLIWFYEKETRLLIKVTGDAAKKIDVKKNYAILMQFDEKLRDSIYVTFAPEIDDIQKAIADKKAIQSHMLKTSRIDESRYKGEIKMKLCDYCIKNTPSNGNPTGK